MSSQNFDRFLTRARVMSDLSATSSTLQWDQETYMPDAAAEGRAEQIATIDTLLHQMATSSEYTTLMDTLRHEAGNGALGDWEKGAVREALRDHERAVKLPDEFVGELSRTQSLAQQAWKHARAESNFALFRDSLAHLLDLKRREAEYLGYAENRYDALIDAFEPGMTVLQLRPVFDRLKAGTQRLMQRIADPGAVVSNEVLHRDYDPDKQLELAKKIVAQLGFDFAAGRVDLSAHPFCTSFGIRDVRLTTRIHRNDLESCLFGLIHEAGHGMYEQGFDPKFARTPLANGTSMGIHESQSLLWENMVARGESFWRWVFPQVREAFPDQLRDATPFSLFRAVNLIQPSFIRVGADELTYNLHIILRFEIEEALVNGQLKIDDIPTAWNDMMQKYLGITPPNDAQGCLQDVHWSFGGFGYFPCYTLGKLYAAMFYRQAATELPAFEETIARGEFTKLVDWLREHVHRWGKMKRAGELAEEICGRKLTEEDFLHYLEAKIDRVYDRNI